MLVTVKNVTMRDGAEEFEIRSAAQIVDVGEDIHGKELTSLVIVPADAPAVPGKRKGRVRVGTPMSAAVTTSSGSMSRHSKSGDSYAVHSKRRRARTGSARESTEHFP
jgi:hypothetical protein